MIQITILKNLLFTMKDNGIESNFISSNNEKIFTINDLIYNYTLEILKKDLFNKDITLKESNELYDLYLYLIFQIKDPNFIIKLKILIYNYLYDKRNIIEFFIESSKDIFAMKNYDKEALKNLQEKYNEIDIINFKIASDNVVSFFKRHRSKIEDLIKIFDKNKIKDNLNKIKSGKINKDDIVIDDPNFDQKKINFFSPEFLIVNGLKSDFENCDFERFNSDNYGVDTISKFLKLIIPEINKSMEENNFPNDFIKNKLIQFHNEDMIHFISAKLDNDTKKDLNKSKNKNFEIIDCQNKFEKNKIINDKDHKENDEPSEESDYLGKSNLSSPELSYHDFQNKNVECLEDLACQKFIKNLEKNKLISLPNILFMLNLKIPQYDEITNTIKFKSIHLDFFKEEEKYIDENYCNGFFDIDAMFYNNSENLVEIDGSEPEYCFVNSTYIKEKIESKIQTNFQEVEEDKFKVYPKSIIFCEIKNSFPNFGIGTEDVPGVKVEEIKSKKNKNNSQINGNLLPRSIKKLKYFLKVFQDNTKEKEELNNIQLIHLYDNYNVDDEKPDLDFDSIKKSTEEKLLDYGDKLENSSKIIFHLIFFDLFLSTNIMSKKIKEKEEIFEKQKEEQKEEQNKLMGEKLESLKKLSKLLFSNHDSIKEILDDKKLEEGEKYKKIFDLFQGQIPIDVIQSFFDKLK